MEHKIWKGSFVISVLITLYWFWETIGCVIVEEIVHGIDVGIAGVICVVIGAFTLPVMAFICAYLAKQAFRE